MIEPCFDGSEAAVRISDTPKSRPTAGAPESEWRTDVQVVMESLFDRGTASSPGDQELDRRVLEPGAGIVLDTESAAIADRVLRARATSYRFMARSILAARSRFRWGETRRLRIAQSQPRLPGGISGNVLLAILAGELEADAARHVGITTGIDQAMQVSANYHKYHNSGPDSEV